jgi:hypothetical protein
MFSLANDFTLRSGDSVMTPSGMMVFRSGGHLPYARDNFATLANASMPKDKKAVLAAIERAALPSARQSSVMLFAPRNSEIAFAAPPVRSKTMAANKSIHFVEPMISASN